MSASSPRIQYLTDEEILAKDAVVASQISSRRKGNFMNLDRLLMNSVPIASGWNSMFGALRESLSINGRIRELIILRVAIINHAPYEYYAHYDVFIREGGTKEEAERLFDWQSTENLHLYSDVDRAVLAYTDACTKLVQVSNEIFSTLKQHFNEEQILEIVCVCSGYNMVSRVLESLQITPDKDPSLLPKFPVECDSSEK